MFCTPEPTTPDEVILGPFWLTPIWGWDAMQDVGLRSHVVASWHVAPHMVAASSGLIVNISSLGAREYYGSVATAPARPGWIDATGSWPSTLLVHNVAALSADPGNIRTERMLEAVCRRRRLTTAAH